MSPFKTPFKGQCNLGYPQPTAIRWLYMPVAVTFSVPILPSTLESGAKTNTAAKKTDTAAKKPIQQLKTPIQQPKK